MISAVFINMCVKVQLLLNTRHTHTHTPRQMDTDQMFHPPTIMLSEVALSSYNLIPLLNVADEEEVCVSSLRGFLNISLTFLSAE